MQSVPLNLPVGWRFCPTNDELLDYYLKKKRLGLPIDGLDIQEVQIYNFDPQDLLDHSSPNNERYFFCRREFYSNTGRFKRKRKGGVGFWERTGEIQSLTSEESDEEIGRKRIFVYYDPYPTKWVMHEYEYTGPLDSPVQGDFVLCKLGINKKKRTNESKRIDRICKNKKQMNKRKNVQGGNKKTKPNNPKPLNFELVTTTNFSNNSGLQTPNLQNIDPFTNIVSIASHLDCQQLQGIDLVSTGFSIDSSSKNLNLQTADPISTSSQTVDPISASLQNFELVTTSSSVDSHLQIQNLPNTEPFSSITPFASHSNYQNHYDVDLVSTSFSRGSDSNTLNFQTFDPISTSSQTVDPFSTSSQNFELVTTSSAIDSDLQVQNLANTELSSNALPFSFQKEYEMNPVSTSSETVDHLSTSLQNFELVTTSSAIDSNLQIQNLENTEFFPNMLAFFQNEYEMDLVSTSFSDGFDSKTLNFQTVDHLSTRSLTVDPFPTSSQNFELVTTSSAIDSDLQVQNLINTELPSNALAFSFQNEYEMDPVSTGSQTVDHPSTSLKNFELFTPSSAVDSDLQVQNLQNTELFQSMLAFAFQNEYEMDLVSTNFSDGFDSKTTVDPVSTSSS